MAASSFDAALKRFDPELPLAVALSGGADSTALLLGCAERFGTRSLYAIHVHHGLQAAADAFEHHCAALCAQLGVPLRVARVDARHASGESPEDAARRARYQALDAEATALGVRSVALAQHADDQVETLLLALSRGAGLPGLAAMPAQWQRGALRYHRPLLAVPGASLREAARARGRSWVDDPTNSDEQFTRNRIRARLLPAIEEVFPQFRETFARSAAHAAQAQALLDEVAAQDFLLAGDPPALAALQSLSAARQGNLLRHWLKTVHRQQASAAQLAELLAQVADCRTRGHRIRLKVGGGFVVRAGDALAFTAAA